MNRFPVDKRTLATSLLKLAALGVLLHYVAGVSAAAALLAVLIIGSVALSVRILSAQTSGQYGPTPGHMRALGYGALLIAAIPVLAYVNERRTTQELQNGLARATNLIGGLDAPPPPGGFAEHCFNLWLSAGPDSRGDDSATRTFIDTCQPGVSPGSLLPQTSGTLQATDTTALLGPGLSYPIGGSPTYYSVLLATHLRAFIQGKKGKPDRWADLGPAYFRSAVYTNPRTGAPALRGLPRQVAAPVNMAAPKLTAVLENASLEDERTAVVTELLHRYLVKPPDDRPHDGDLGQYIIPSATDVSTVHAATITDVTVLQTAYSDPAPGTGYVDALAEVQVTYAGDRVSVQQYPLTLVKTGGQWQGVTMPGGPELETP